MTKPHVLIAGAGLAGLTAALALLKRGFDVDVYEQASQLGEVGAGLQISANGTRIFYALGIGDELRAMSSEPAGKEIRLWNTGQSWKLFDLGMESVARYGAPYFTIYRPDVHGVLVDAVRREKPDAIHLNAKCVAAGQAGGRVTLRLANGRAISADALVGADGVHSQVRQDLFGKDKPTFSGCVAWRGVIPMKKLPAHLARPVGTNWVGPGAHVVHYPLRRGELMNFVGVVERHDWQMESWTERGTCEECEQDFKGWNEDVHALIRNVAQHYKWALMVREPMSRWSEGCITLVGDACHPTLPFLAQGAVMAIEDGYILARCLEKYAADVPRAFDVYQNARTDRTAKIVRGSAENAKRFHDNRLSDPVAASQYVDREWSEDKVRQRYHWLFEYDAVNIAIG